MLLTRCQLWLTLTLFAPLWTAQNTLAAKPTPTAQTTGTVNIENSILRFSYELENFIDQQKRPCEDFFGYVCARSLNATQVQLAQRIQNEKQKFENFLAADNNEQFTDAELKLKYFYDSCKNARSLEELRGTLMYRHSGGWPAVEDPTQVLQNRRQNITWTDVLSTFHAAGLEYFFRQRVEIKSNKRSVQLQPDVLTRYTLRKFEQLASDVLQRYAVNEGRGRLVALEILNFERNRRDIVKTPANADEQEFSYAEFKSKPLFGNAIQIDWDAYFKKILGKTLKSSDTIVIKELPKMVQLFELLQNTSMPRLLNWIWIDYLMDKSSDDCQSLALYNFDAVYEHIVARAAIDKVQMAQMYAELGRAYDELLPATPWIDEMSQQNSKLFLGRIIHLTLNGDAKLDEDFATITITKRNFYRNLEKLHRFQAQQRRSQRTSSTPNAVQLTHAAAEYMKVFQVINTLLQQQNLTSPLNYVLVGERFAERMIAAGGSTDTPGAWRSMDSEREFATFEQCITQQSGGNGNETTTKYNLNNLLLKLLAQQQTLHALTKWQEQQQDSAALLSRLDRLLAAGRLQLSLRKLYFIGMTLLDCRNVAASPNAQRDFVQRYLRNSVEFTQIFGCRTGDALFGTPNDVCKVF